LSKVQVIFFKRSDDTVPMKDWLDNLQAKDRRKCLERIERLRNQGHELNRPFAAYLKDDIYELRVKCGNVNYRMLYFFYERSAVVIFHGLVKKTQRVPSQDIDRALERKAEFKRDPDLHTFEQEH
jgi:phage-related protein